MLYCDIQGLPLSVPRPYFWALVFSRSLFILHTDYVLDFFPTRTHKCFLLPWCLPRSLYSYLIFPLNFSYCTLLATLYNLMSYYFVLLLLTIFSFTLALWGSWTGVAQLSGHGPAKQNVPGLIPSQGTRLGCRFGSWLGCMREATDLCFSVTSVFSPSLSSSLSLSLKINIYNLLIKCP